jgi:hypothetical protein
MSKTVLYRRTGRPSTTIMISSAFPVLANGAIVQRLRDTWVKNQSPVSLN